MLGFLMMVAVGLTALFLLFFKTYPAMAFRYTGRGERKARSEYQRISREHPDSPEAQRSEAEFVEAFVANGPSPWKYILMIVLLLTLGLPLSCVLGIAGMG